MALVTRTKRKLIPYTNVKDLNTLEEMEVEELKSQQKNLKYRTKNAEIHTSKQYKVITVWSFRAVRQ